VEIDGRGTGQKGLDMMFSVNNRLGTYEMEDQIAVTKYLVNKYPFIDASRVAIWGWSYGNEFRCKRTCEMMSFFFV
jgi:dipeptidyl-peptidase 4